MCQPISCSRTLPTVCLLALCWDFSREFQSWFHLLYSSKQSNLQIWFAFHRRGPEPQERLAQTSTTPGTKAGSWGMPVGILGKTLSAYSWQCWQQKLFTLCLLNRFGKPPCLPKSQSKPGLCIGFWEHWVKRWEVWYLVFFLQRMPAIPVEAV